MKIGDINKLKVSRNSPYGMYLIDDAGDEVLLPKKYLTGNEKEGDFISTFIYNDSEDRLVATTEIPKIKLNEIAVLKVVDVTKHGVFLDWGLEKDLMVPFKEQNKKMLLGHAYVVCMFLDHDTDRLVATTKIKRFLSNDHLEIKEKEQVDLLVYNKSELGYEVVINGKHTGLVFSNEVFSPLKIGDQLTGYIKNIRKDGKIDVSLQPDMTTHLKKSNELIINALKANGGELNLSDRSSPEDIYRNLNMSKKTFKKAIGALYKQRRIVIRPDRISLVE